MFRLYNAAANMHTFQDNWATMFQVAQQCLAADVSCALNHSTMTDCRAVCKPTAMSAYAADDTASQATGRQQGSGVLHQYPQRADYGTISII